MRFKRFLALLLVILFAAASLSACELFSSKGSVYWLNYKPELEDTLLSLAERYQAETGVTVTIVTPASGTYRRALREAMESQEQPTLFVVNDLSSAEEWSDTALDLSDTELYDELTTHSYDLSDEDDRVVAIPYCLECFGIAVNPEIMEIVGFSADDINSFSTLSQLAQAIHNNADWLGFDAFASPDLDDENAWRLTAHLANLEYYYEEDASDGWDECPASLTGEFLPNYKALYDLIINNSVSAPETLAKGGHQPLEEFMSGKAAFCLAGSWDYARLSEAVPDVTMIPYYCGVEGEKKAALNSGSENFWAVNAYASEDDQKATLDFMKWLVSDADASRELTLQLGNLPYQSSAEVSNGFIERQDSYLDDGRYRMDWLMAYQPNTDVYRDDLADALSVYNEEQTDENWQKVKTAFVDGWAKQYAAVNNAK